MAVYYTKRSIHPLKSLVFSPVGRLEMPDGRTGLVPDDITIVEEDCDK